MKRQLVFLVYFGLVSSFGVPFLDILQTSLYNLKVLKAIATYGSDQQLLFPLGKCSTVTANVSTAPPYEYLNASLNITGIAFLRSGAWQYAEWYLQEALQQGRARSVSGYALGAVRVFLGQDPIPVWKQVGASQRMLSIARQCTLEGNMSLAYRYYHMALDTLGPNDLAGFRQLVLFFASTQDEDAFIRSREGFLALVSPNSPDYYRTMGTVYLSRAQPAEAREYFLTLAMLNPTEADAWYYAGQAEVALGNYGQARQYFTDAIRLSPTQASPYIYIGHTFLYERKYDLAADWYHQALGIEPGNGWAMLSLAQVRMEQARYEDALNIALQVMDKDSRAHVPALAAKAAMQLGKWQQAKQLIEQAISIDTRNVTYLLQQATICEAIGEIECARRSYESVLEIEPRHSLARDRLEKSKGGLR